MLSNTLFEKFKWKAIFRTHASCLSEHFSNMSIGTSGVEKALETLRKLPRVSIANCRPLNELKIKKKVGRGQHGGQEHFHKKQGSNKHQAYYRPGFEGNSFPWYMRIPKEPYYKGHHMKRQYPPVTLGALQMMIDTNQINPNEPIDLTTICNTNLYWLKPFERHFGFNLTDQGADVFKAKVNIEVQWATENVIAAVERNGGSITTAFYDIPSVCAALDPESFFSQGKPIPKRALPSEDLMDYYTDPNNRGYLADPDEIGKKRVNLSQKYGYQLADLTKDDQCEMLLRRKDPRQVFHGLQPGWVVSLKDKVIFKPKDPELVKYYNS